MTLELWRCDPSSLPPLTPDEDDMELKEINESEELKSIDEEKVDQPKAEDMPTFEEESGVKAVETESS